MEARETSRRDLLVILVIALLVPLLLRPAATRLNAGAPASYLPALDPYRARRPFDPTFRDDLRRIRPKYVFIGDSMLGSRIDPTHMTRHIRQQTWWVMQPGTGSAYWYLAFKNAVLGAGVKPKAVFFFFRDDNLTDIMFRLDQHFRWTVDTMAEEREPELNAAIARRTQGGWHRVHDLVDQAYRVHAVSASAESWLRDWPARVAAGEPDAAAFHKQLNGLFAFDKLRPTAATDVANVAAPRADFRRQVEASILPEMLRLGREHGVTLCFVRVQRRPRADGPPVESPALVRYMAELRQYLEANGAMFRDDTGDPDYTLDWYKDGDHTGGWTRRRYTELFAVKLAPLFR